MERHDIRFQVRAAVAADLPAVASLAGHLVRQHHGVDPDRFLCIEPVERGYEAFFRKELERREVVLLVAESTAEILGYVYGCLEPRDWNALLGPSGRVHDLYVEQSARRSGVGSALLLEGIRALLALGAPRIVLMSAWANTEAHRLFERVGFRKTMVEMTLERSQIP